MIAIRVGNDLGRLLNLLDGFSNEEMLKITKKTLDAAAFDFRYAIQKVMKEVFDRPTPWTIKQLFVKQATLSNLTARVYWNEFAGKGTSPGQYLLPQVEGGGRPQKKSERELSKIKYGGQILYLTPGPGVRLNQYGNVPAGMYTKVMQYFELFSNRSGFNTRGGGRRANPRSRTKEEFFIILPGQKNAGGLSPGVYVRIGRGFRHIFNIVTHVQYKKIFQFYEIANERVADQLRRNFEIAVQKVIAERKSIAA